MDAPVEVVLRPYRLPFRTPLRTAHGPWTEREGILLRIVAADGRVGYGEIAPIEALGGAPSRSARLLFLASGRLPRARS